MRNINTLSISNRFSKVLSLVSPKHADSLLVMSASPKDTQEIEADVIAQCAASLGFGVTDERKPFMFSDGVAVIPVYGALLHRDNWCSSYATGYDYIAARFDAANNDPDVTGIVFDINSFGGQVNGNFELCDKIFAGRAKKPSLAIVDAMAYSGGYSLASACGKIVATPSAGVGSIGVVMLHVSYEKLLADAGIVPTFIYAGEHKVEGNMYQDMSEETKARFQASVDKSYKKFVALVARNRSLDPEKVQATEASCFDADEALALGLLDSISAPQDAMLSFRNELKGSSFKSKPTQGAKKMSDNTEDKTISQADLDAATAAAAKTAATAARERISAIQGSDEAKDRSKLASHIALNTEMSVEDAKAMLAASPAETKEAAKPSGFNAVMENHRPAVGADGGDNPGDEPKPDVSSRLLAAHQKATGTVVKK